MTISGILLAFFIMWQLNRVDELERNESARKHKERMGK